MKRFLLCFFFLVIPSLLYGGEVASINGVADSAIASIDGVTGTGIASISGVDYDDGDGAGPTYLDNLACDDNAANSTVVNAGTAGDVWYCREAIGDDTANIHSATVYEGTGSFLFDGVNDYIANDAWNVEKFELIFWARFLNVTASGYELWFHVSGQATAEAREDFNEDPNEIFLYRADGSKEWSFTVRGNNASASVKSRETTNFDSALTVDNTSWFRMRLLVDTSLATPTVQLFAKKGAGAEVELTFASGDWATGYACAWTNASAFFGDTAGAYPPDGYLDAVTMEDKS